MLQPRIIPCLLIKDGGLVKTVNFSEPKYIGDPINAVKIFNEKKIDELIVLDIDATVNKQEPDFTLISKLASECRMPLCYGGGIKSVEQIKKIISLGVEKISISSQSILDPNIISQASMLVGNQSIVATLDIKTENGKLSLFTHNGKIKVDKDPLDLIRKLQRQGVGEIVINSISNEGTMLGYNTNLIDRIIKKIDVPLTIIGGAGSHKDIHQLFKKYGLLGAGAGSLFVFKGQFRAVLINYPNDEEKKNILSGYKLDY
ncbi:MAG: imidazole glycerol phosphate synthase subunit HisF [bacterium TMED264]|nr:MAG: imidazole glycerol phosphate synthase subunit HisF [bacterium TMED264]